MELQVCQTTVVLLLYVVNGKLAFDCQCYQRLADDFNFLYTL